MKVIEILLKNPDKHHCIFIQQGHRITAKASQRDHMVTLNIVLEILGEDSLGEKCWCPARPGNYTYNYKLQQLESYYGSNSTLDPFLKSFIEKLLSSEFDDP